MLDASTLTYHSPLENIKKATWPNFSLKTTQMQALEVSGSTMVSSAPSDLSVLTDLDTMFTSETLNARNGRWIYVDFLEWMGDIMASPTGRITCPSPGCGYVNRSMDFSQRAIYDDLGVWFLFCVAPVSCPGASRRVLLSKSTSSFSLKKTFRFLSSSSVAARGKKR